MILKLPRSRRNDLDDKTGENIFGIVDVRVALDDEGVASLVADRVKRLPFELALVDLISIKASKATEQYHEAASTSPVDFIFMGFLEEETMEGIEKQRLGFLKEAL
ncbi:hypothetical protein F3Y22_tig00110328pilonHSYRG00155 [Hibiscus syriacus]|uniref:Uncharacterized protein n=1 Tax=Hibiscus syriacus TaxID=106335 RepID=A0A6A3B0I6_HIBSY|nr:hypothetical protein F3Y22_tig00110328pilonHSYRG00155 [Hibiscus syriacus]